MPVNCREIRDEGGQHRRPFADKRRRGVSPGESAPAEELMHQNPHRMEYIGTHL